MPVRRFHRRASKTAVPFVRRAHGYSSCRFATRTTATACAVACRTLGTRLAAAPFVRPASGPPNNTTAHGALPVHRWRGACPVVGGPDTGRFVSGCRRHKRSGTAMKNPCGGWLIASATSHPPNGIPSGRVSDPPGASVNTSDRPSGLPLRPRYERRFGSANCSRPP